MDHALTMAAGAAPGAEQILSVAGRLARESDAAMAFPAARGQGGPAPAVAADNLGTLRACQSLLRQTLRLLG